jgi:hypothetical protein
VCVHMRELYVCVRACAIVCVCACVCVCVCVCVCARALPFDLRCEETPQLLAEANTCYGY